MVHPIDILNAGVPVNIKWLLEQVRGSISCLKTFNIRRNIQANVIYIFLSNTFQSFAVQPSVIEKIM